jgi:dipeptidyl aminopeptidase/acylaminoacyl peptidase
MRIQRHAAALVLLVSLGCDSPVGPVDDGAAIGAELPWQHLSGRIAFATGDCSGVDGCDGTIHVADAATETVRQLLDSSLMPPGALAFTPDGRSLTASVFRGFPELGDFYFTYQLYTIDLAHPDLVPLRPDPLDSHHAFGWSSDGRLALVRTVDLGGGQFRSGGITIDDLVLSDVSGSPEGLSRITWSPDGSEIVLAMRRGGPTPHLYAISIADQQVTPLMPDVPAETYSVNPAYSPDGERIAYEDASAGQTQIWVLERATGTRVRLTSGAMDHDPAWSPDGATILFIRNNQPHIIDVGSKSVTRLMRRIVNAVAWAE